MARNERPKVVRCTSNQIPTATPIKIHTWAGMPAKSEFPNARNDGGKPEYDSAPRVSASAKPRKSENVPSVTINGGRFSRVINTALKPPPNAPIPTTAKLASHGSIPSRLTIMPNNTAHNPIIDPTDKSIPPVRITGVMATASRPISTEWRKTLETFRPIKKLRPNNWKSTTSTRITSNSTTSWRASNDFNEIDLELGMMFVG